MDKGNCKKKESILKKHKKKIIIGASIVAVIVGGAVVIRCCRDGKLGLESSFALRTVPIDAEVEKPELGLENEVEIQELFQKARSTPEEHLRRAHPRNLPNGYKASKEKIEEAISMGLSLKPNQTFVRETTVNEKVA